MMPRMLRVSAWWAQGCAERSRISWTACSIRSGGTLRGSPKHMRIIARTLCSGVTAPIRRAASDGIPGTRRSSNARLNAGGTR
jgi:hypothetical protein